MRMMIFGHALLSLFDQHLDEDDVEDDDEDDGEDNGDGGDDVDDDDIWTCTCLSLINIGMIMMMTRDFVFLQCTKIGPK